MPAKRPLHPEQARKTRDAARGEDIEVLHVRKIIRDNRNNKGSFGHLPLLLVRTFGAQYGSPSTFVCSITLEGGRITQKEYEAFRDNPDAPFVNGKLDPVQAHICKVISFTHPTIARENAARTAAELAKKRAANPPRPSEPITSLAPETGGARRPKGSGGFDIGPIVGVDGKIVEP